ncbi:hypothetical protein Bca101_026050 [Brassica carinata]
MANVAHKLEKLEMVLSNDDVLVSNSLNDTVHYNPSDLSVLTVTMLSELNHYPPSPVLHPTRIYDLRPFPDDDECCITSSKRIRRLSESTQPPVVLAVDSHEAGVRLVQALVARGQWGKVATYFTEALARKIYRIHPLSGAVNPSFEEILQMHFYDSCPYLKFAHFTANQAILEAVATVRGVHVIDLGLNQGMQWPALMQALALRPGGTPSFRLTGVGSPSDQGIQRLGWKLAQLAQAVGVEFEFKCLTDERLSDLKPEIFKTRPESETLVVNSFFELHTLLAQPGSIEKLLTTVKAVKPSVVTVVEQEANHNGVVFLGRFNEALHYYSSLFDSLEDGLKLPSRDQAMSKWRKWIGSAGFDPVNLGSNTFKLASLLLALSGSGDGYRVEENEGSLMLAWQTNPLIAASAWKPSAIAVEDYVV